MRARTRAGEWGGSVARQRLHLCMQRVAVCCSVLQCVAVCCSVLQYVTVCDSVFGSKLCSVLQCVAVCCSVLRCVAVCCGVLQCVAVETRFGAFTTVRVLAERKHLSFSLTHTKSRQLGVSVSELHELNEFSKFHELNESSTKHKTHM